MIFPLNNQYSAANLLESRNFTELIFVFVITVIAGSKPTLQCTLAFVRFVACGSVAVMHCAFRRRAYPRTAAPVHPRTESHDLRL